MSAERTDLALAADLAPATVTQMLDSLEAAGLVERVRSQRDRRVVLIPLTERRGARGGAPRALRAALARCARRVRRDDLLIAASVVDRLREMFYDVADAEPPLPAEDEQVGVSAR
jgi:DNA-binding IclR family transcriptional regulator